MILLFVVLAHIVMIQVCREGNSRGTVASLTADLEAGPYEYWTATVIHLAQQKVHTIEDHFQITSRCFHKGMGTKTSPVSTTIMSTLDIWWECKDRIDSKENSVMTRCSFWRYLSMSTPSFLEGRVPNSVSGIKL